MEDWSKYKANFRYMMLDRLRQDCEYYLGNGNRHAGHLWAHNEVEQIENMKALWNTFEPEDRPEWLTMEQIDDYARRMGVELDD